MAVQHTNVINTGNSSSTTPSATTISTNNKNVLYNYRSVTYNFTLAALKASALQDPSSLPTSSSDFIILKSGGKANGMNASAASAITTDNPGSETKDSDGNPIPPASEQTAQYAQDLVSGFNALSPGRFDMFIDNVEIDTIMTPSKETGSALATKIKFDVIEPYSMNGFIEALRVSSRAAGWPTYLSALFLLKLEFKGYSDKSQGPSDKPESVPNATRYFPIRLTGVQVSVTESGTRYACSAVPFNEIGFSKPNTLVGEIQISGTTVGEILDNMITGLNTKLKKQAQNEQDPEKAKSIDTYEIYFPNIEDGKEITPTTLKNETKATRNPIASSKINKILTDNNIFKFPNPGTGYLSDKKSAGAGQGSAEAAASDPRLTDAQKAEIAAQQQKKQEEDAHNPSEVAIMFSNDAQIHDIIAAVIRDSEYLRDILVDVDKAKDAQGMIKYFKVHINTITKDLNSSTGRHNTVYQYVVTPYKVHYSILPGQALTQFDPASLKPLIKRDYNYIYTGKNLDITSFKIDFNTLYFQQANPNTGNTDNSGTANTPAASSDQKAQLAKGAAIAPADQKVAPPVMQQDSSASSQNLRAGTKKTDPYWMGQNAAHEAILKSVDQIKAELDILGDPYYVVTGGAGNYIPPASDPAITNSGEANVQGAQALVNFTFRNPSDISSQTGLMKFDTIADYSGVYRVIQSVNTFKDGMFKSHLKMLRLAGQQAGASDKAYSLIEQPKSGDQPVKDTAPDDVVQAGTRPNEISLTNMVKRGLPSAGLPGVLSNFSNAVGSASGLLNQVGGVVQQGINAISKVNQITNFALVSPAASSAISAISSGVRLATNGLSLTAGLTNFASGAVNNAIGSAAAVQGALNNATGAINNIGSIAGASNILGAASSIDVANAKDKISAALAGNASAITAKLGIDTSQLAGLGGSLDSNIVNQVADIAKKLPAGVDLTASASAGLLLAKLKSNAIANLPATMPKTVAPIPDLNLADSLGPTEYVNTLAAQIKTAQGGDTTPDVTTSADSAVPSSLSGAMSKLSSLAGNATGALSGALQGPLNLSSVASQVKSVGVQFGSLATAAATAPGNLVGQVTSLTASASDVSGALSGNLAGLKSSILTNPMSGISSAAAQAATSIANLNVDDLKSQEAALKNLSASDLKSKLDSFASVSGIDTSNFYDSSGNIDLNSIKQSVASSLDPASIAASSLSSAVSPLQSLMGGSLNNLPNPANALAGISNNLTSPGSSLDTTGLTSGLDTAAIKQTLADAKARALAGVKSGTFFS
jgi:hypothetical protein